MKKVAIILSGCGVSDGSEIHESCAALLAVQHAGAEAVICAPSGPQRHVIDHLSGDCDPSESRDMLKEAARIARGLIKSLSATDPGTIDAVILPGGFGAAKNLCTFATEGAACSVNPEVRSFLENANATGKAIGAMCIAPVILARVFGPRLHPRLTIGDDADTAAAITEMGAVHVNCTATEVVTDAANRMVTTPAYMLAADIGEVFLGAEKFVAGLLDLCS